MKKKNLLKNDAVQSLLASLGCIVFGLLVGYVVLLFIQPKGAGKAILTIIENFFTYNRAETQMKYLGSTLVKTAPLLMCSLSILFAYKVGLFNIGAAGQYVVGSCASLYAALAWGWSWLPCMLFAVAAGMAAGAIVGLLKTFCNVNEVISGIMLNWIFLYATNMILTNVKEVASPYTYQMHSAAQQALLPSLGLDKLFSGNQYVTIAIPLAILMAILVWVVLEKTRFGYELKATGFNKHAAKYCGMAERRNTVLTLAIAGGLAGAWRLAAVPDRLRAVAVHALLRAEHGLQRHLRRVPRRPEPDRRDLLVVLHPAHHLRRRVCGQEPLLLADLGSDHGDHHLYVRLRALPENGHEQQRCPPRGAAAAGGRVCARRSGDGGGLRSGTGDCIPASTGRF